MQKAIWLPLALLAVLLAGCLLTGRTVSQRSDHWNQQLDQALAQAKAENWSLAQQTVREVYTGWTDSQLFLHIVLEHDELDKAEALFQTALLMAEDEDETEFRIHVCQVQSQFLLLKEMQAMSIQNIL